MSELPSDEQRHSVPETRPGYVIGYGHYPWLRVRSIVGGIFMGLASVVPGVSGGTMLLAAGVHPYFLEGLYEMSSLRFRRRSAYVVGIVLVCALLSVGLLGPYMRAITTQHRWMSYSLFAGLAAGGIPVVVGMAKPFTTRTWVTAAAAFAFVVGMTSLRVFMGVPIAEKVGFAWYFLGGMAAGAAMLLPGISGAYLMVILGVFLPIMGALDRLRVGYELGQFGVALGETGRILAPAALGVAVGIFLLARVFHRILHADRSATLGTLVGLLVGALIELYPFQRIVQPSVGDVVGGRVLTAESLAQLRTWHYPTEYFTPNAGEIVTALIFFLLGVVLTSMGARFGAKNESGFDLAARTNP